MCDTFVAMSPATSDGTVIFGKNSDREPNEAQSLEYHPKKTHKSGALAHEFKIVNSYDFNDWTFSTTWIYASGRPYTEPAGVEEKK